MFPFTGKYQINIQNRNGLWSEKGECFSRYLKYILKKRNAIITDENNLGIEFKTRVRDQNCSISLMGMIDSGSFNFQQRESELVFSYEFKMTRIFKICLGIAVLVGIFTQSFIDLIIIAVVTVFIAILGNFIALYSHSQFFHEIVEKSKRILIE